ncbi:MAG TPA: SAM-dependent methyltransferase, partial [Aliiroseovarius sp.]|nr:SAM-dependent methyltransferase [Aliiroseovarius sp.]
MNTPPKLTDRRALLRNRTRASDDALFLQRLARDEVEDRLTMVNRTFTNPAIVTGFPQIWRELMPKARIVADEEVLDLVPGAYDLVIHAMGLHWANDP